MMLKDKTAIITGGGRGIGRAIALTFAQAGADVVVVSRTRSELEAVASEVGEIGRRTLVVVADISDPAAVSRMVADTLREFGQIDILVNNAAIHEPKPVAETSLEDWNRTIKINLTGVFLCSQAVLEHMIGRRDGKIINISSGAGLRGFPGNAAYSASKGGVIAFTQALAGEVRELGIKVNVICPGPINTQMHAARPREGFFAKLPGFLEPEEVAGAALFLASDYSGRMNAQIIQVRNSDRW
jgi:3-oxoacyl-[acyl-carrier protein] reductase